MIKKQKAAVSQKTSTARLSRKNIETPRAIMLSQPAMQLTEACHRRFLSASAECGELTLQGVIKSG